MRALTAAAAAAAVLLLGGCPAEPSAASSTEPQAITVKGSDTMVHLVAAWAEAYMKAHPEAEVTVTGGGTGTGIAALINGTTDLAMASRDMKAEERALAEKGGRALERVVVGLDGIAIVVHPDNPVRELTLDQLRQVFNGTLKRWSQVGGPDQPIQVLSRESSSGTYGFFKEHVLKNDDFGPEVRLMASTSAIVQAAGQDVWSIGYVGLGYVQEGGLAVVKVKADAAAPAVAPSIATVKDKTYPIARELLLYGPSPRAGLGERLLEFVLSPEGQRIVSDNGYVPL